MKCCSVSSVGYKTGPDCSLPHYKQNYKLVLRIIDPMWDVGLGSGGQDPTTIYLNMFNNVVSFEVLSTLKLFVP